MNNLTIINYNGINVTDSREISKMIGKRHDHLVRDIDGYVSILNQNPKLGADNFFIESNYSSGTGKNYKCYLLTKQGCEMVANKMTGQKGVLFTAEYIQAFNKMEQVLQQNKPTCVEDVLIQSLQEMKDVKLQLQEVKQANADTKQEIQDMRDTITLSPTSWRKDTTALVNKIALNIGGYDHIKAIREESYKFLNERMGVDVKTRLTNKRRRMADEGVCKSKRDKLTILDVIQDDKKLIEGYVAIIKEMVIKHGI